MLLVSFTSFPPEWKGSNITEGDSTGDEWAIESWVSEATNLVGDGSENSRGNSLSESNAEEVNGNNITLLT